ncbi:RepB [Lactiplantibacillus plantarum]|nr:RepB [Lactiplantibacillus plantarum]
MKEVISLILKQITPNIYNADIRGYSFNVFEGLFVKNPPITLETGNDLNTDKAEEIEKVRNEPKTPETAKKRHWWQRR